jgi:ELWxxDGT repeat protein
VTPPQQFTSVGDQLLFSAFDGEGWELWKSGPAGTLRVKDIHPGSTFSPYGQAYPNSSFPTSLVNLKGTLYFAATGADGRELWKSNGTEAGTILVKDIFPGFSPYQSPYFPYNYPAYDSSPTDIVNRGGTLFFSAFTLETGRGLWKSDGTAAGTAAVKGAAEGLSIPATADFTVAGSTVYFQGKGADGYELWKTDGTASGTVQVKDIRVGPGGSYVEQLTNVAGKLYFVARDGNAGGKELWQSDGTDAGTYLVKDIRSGLDASNYPNGSNPANLVGLNGVLFFTADDGVHGRELWRTNGNGDAVLIEDLVAGPGSSLPQNLFPRANALFFSATTATGRELWRAGSAAPVLTMVWRAGSAAPVLTMPAPIFTHTEDGVGKILAATAQLSDADTAILVGGRVKISVVGHPSAGDLLTIASNNVISTAGNVIYHKVNFLNIAIGTFLGGSNGKPLVIELNQNATVDEVEALIRAIHYRTTSQNPSTLRRTIRFEVTDGEGTAAPFKEVKVDVVRRNDAPVLNTALNPTLNAILEDATNPSGTLVKNFAAAGITDADGDPKGIAITTAGGILKGHWQFSLDNGANWQELGSPGESAARLLRADAVTRVRFIPNPNFHGEVQLFYRAWDGTLGTNGDVMSTAGQLGGTKAFSNAVEVATLTVNPVNDAPVLTLGGSIGYQHNTAAITLAPNATLTDADKTDFAGGQLTVRIGAGASGANRLEIGSGFMVDGLNVRFGDTVIGTLNENGGVGLTKLVVTFNASASQQIVQLLVRSITFRTIGGAAGQRKILFSVTDGDGGSSGELTKTVNVT